MNMTVKEAIAEATAQKKEKVTFEKFGEALGVSKQYISQIQNKQLSTEQIALLELAFGINLTNVNNNEKNCIPITYRPDVYLSAGYGVEVYDENKETLMIDSRLLISERGNKINPDNCEVVRVSGNSMFPEYRHGDRVFC